MRMPNYKTTKCIVKTVGEYKVRNITVDGNTEKPKYCFINMKRYSIDRKPGRLKFVHRNEVLTFVRRA